MSTEDYFHRLAAEVSNQKAAFWCGGTISISPNKDLTVESPAEHTFISKQSLSSPIVLRWDVPGGNEIRKLTLPPSHNNGVEGTDEVEALSRGCMPATFGHKGEDVLDETYRKASKLDNNDFSSNFNPYEVGIVDSIKQTLIPGLAQTLANGKSTFGDHLGVVAELYKLNMYSGPSGKFRAHVDTPRGSKQFGSLVICLPYPHQGGQLRVTHQGEEKVFDWSQEEANSIQWAAFYSDCEHEVMEVQNGHRITLTYNLYAQEQTTSTMANNTMADSQQSRLHHCLIDALKSADFFPSGGTLGFYCQHAYAHTSENRAHRLPYALKGVDAKFYSVFHRLGFNATVKPVIPDERGNFEEDRINRKENEDQEVKEGEFANMDLVGTDIHPLTLSDVGAYDDDPNTTEIMEEAWPSDWRNDIRWFNKSGPKETAIVHMHYGNEASLIWHYSCAAVLVEVPAIDSLLRKKAIEQ